MYLYPSTHLIVHPPIVSINHLFTLSIIYISTIPIYLYLSIYFPFTYLLSNLSIYLSITYLSMFLSTYLSIFISLVTYQSFYL